jgi:hypothetical protein
MSHPHDEGSTHLWNVGLLQGVCTELYPRSLSSSYLPPWEPEISHSKFPTNISTAYVKRVVTNFVDVTEPTELLKSGAINSSKAVDLLGIAV